MLIIAIILFGMLVGAAAQLILGRSNGRTDWAKAIVAGLGGSFVGGLLISLLSGDGLAERHHRLAGRRGPDHGRLAVVGRPQQADRGRPRRQAVG